MGDRLQGTIPHGNADPAGPPAEPWPTEHAAGCIFGGFGCHYWMIVDGCPEEHWERHYVIDDERCPCGTHWLGAPRGLVIADATGDDDA